MGYDTMQLTPPTAGGSHPLVKPALDLETIRQRLARRRHRATAAAESMRRAAVAAILRDRGPDSEILLIRRAEKEGDPWSGHMAFPGGHQEPGDEDLLSTALRETHEEIGLDLRRQGHVIGRLDDLEARAHGRFVGMVVSPFVFAVDAEPLVRPNAEVADVLWAPLGPLTRGELDTIKIYDWQGEKIELPAYSVGAHLVWGMTHQMLQGLLQLMREPG